MRSPNIDPAVQRELDLLDAALAGERQDLEVAIIADEARSAAEPMPPGLALRLESAIAEGFAKQAKPKRSWIMGPAVGVAAAGLIAVVVALGGGADESTMSSDGGSTSAPSAAQSESAAAPNGGAAADAAGKAVPTPLPSMAAPAAPEELQADTDAAPRGRRVQRAAELTLSTPLAKLQETSDEVTRATDRLGGHVQSSDVYAGEDRGRATFDLRIPADRLDDALAALSKLGHVKSRTQQSEDITARFTSARSRLIDARAERQALLRALAAATTEQEIDSVKQRLEIANGRIGAARGDLLSARRAAGLARVSVTVVGAEGEEEGGGAGGGTWTPGQALDDAVAVLSVAAGVLIVTLAASIPAGILLGLLALAWRAWRRRSRDLALGGTAV